jgi:hypothetical protein
MTIRTRGLALLDPNGKVIGSMDSACFDLLTNECRQFRAVRHPTNDELADRRAAILCTRTPTMQSQIKGWNRLK